MRVLYCSTYRYMSASAPIETIAYCLALALQCIARLLASSTERTISLGAVRKLSEDKVWERIIVGVTNVGDGLRIVYMPLVRG